MRLTANSGEHAHFEYELPEGTKDIVVAFGAVDDASKCQLGLGDDAHGAVLVAGGGRAGRHVVPKAAWSSFETAPPEGLPRAAWAVRLLLRTAPRRRN